MAQKTSEGKVSEELIAVFKKRAKSWYTKMTQRNIPESQMCVLLHRWTDEGGESAADYLFLDTEEGATAAKTILSANFTRLGWK